MKGKQLTNFVLQETTPAALVAGNNNDYSAVGFNGFIRVSGDPITSIITGIADGIAGKLICLVNISANTIDITNEDLASFAINRFITRTLGTITLLSGRTILFIYDGVTLRWRQISII